MEYPFLGKDLHIVAGDGNDLIVGNILGSNPLVTTISISGNAVGGEYNRVGVKEHANVQKDFVQFRSDLCQCAITQPQAHFIHGAFGRVLKEHLDQNFIIPDIHHFTPEPPRPWT